MTTHIRPLDAEHFDEEVRSSDRLVLVDVWAEWCPPCHRVAPEIEAVAADLGDRLEVRSLDQDAHPEIGRRYGVMSLPTLLLFRDGELVRQLVGARSRRQLRAELDELLDVTEVRGASDAVPSTQGSAVLG